MPTVSIREAKTHLSRLIERSLAGESVVIAKAGKLVVKLVPVDAPSSAARRRLGCLEGAFEVPEDFDRMGQAEIERSFGLAE